MKKERNYNMNPYPVYPGYSGMGPNMGMNPGYGMMPSMPAPGVMLNNVDVMPNPSMGMPSGIGMPSATCVMNTTGGVDAQLSAINNRINNLEKRISRLEGMPGESSSHKYNDSNYYMV